MGGVLKIRATIWGVPIIRIIVFGVYTGVRLFWKTTIKSRIHASSALSTQLQNQPTPSSENPAGPTNLINSAQTESPPENKSL